MLNIFKLKMIKFFSKNRKIIIIAIIIVIFLFGSNNALALTTGEAAIGLGGYALGTVGYAVSLVLSIIAYVLTAVIGLLITVVVAVLIQVAQYGNIINVPTVIEGWVIIRDLCNMLFILILLIIAFATILRVESYNYKKLLPKLLIMAILINFSRTIFGLLVDFSQVIMLTFVNSFKEGGGWFISVFRTDKLFSIKVLDTTGSKFVVDTWSTAVAIIAGVLAAIITLIVVSIMLAVLVVRIIMLWIYTIFSPLIFLGFAVPGIQKYTGRIWEDFIKQLVVGPVLAFFIWLALTTANKSAGLLMEQDLTSTEVCVGAGAFFCKDNFQQFIIVIGLMVGGLMVAQQTGGAVGSIAGKGMDWAKKVASVPHRGLKVLRDYPIDLLQRKGIVDLNLSRVWKGIKEKRADIKKKQYGEGMVAAAEKMREKGRFFGALAMTATPGSAFEQLTTKAGWSRRFTGGKNAQKYIKDLAEKRDASQTSINIIKDNEDYKEAVRISGAILPQQRNDIMDEQKILAKDIAELDKEIRFWASEIAAAEASDNSLAIKAAKDESDRLTNEKKSKLDFYSSNEEVLSHPAYSNDEINEAKKQRESFETTIKVWQKDIDSKNNQILQYKPIVDFEAVAMQGALEAEEMKKVDHIKDRDELASMLRDAIKSGNKTRFSAIALKLTKDGNENDGVLNNLGFESNAQGLQDLIKSISSKEYVNSKDETVKSSNYMGFSDQAAKALGMKISYAAEATNHWGTARAFKMEDGNYKDASKYDQAIAAASEIAKMDPQQIAIRLNRLGYGGESPDGKFTLNEFGLAILKAIGPSVFDHMNRFNPNAAARLSTPENIKLMVEVGVSPKFINGLQLKRQSKVLTVPTAIDELKAKGYFK